MRADMNAEDANILVLNVGSSSLSFKLYRESSVILRGKCHRVGVVSTQPSFFEVSNGDESLRGVDLPDHRTAAANILDHLASHRYEVDVVGHRFADGGQYFTRSVIVNAQTRPLLEKCAPLAPLHSCAALDIIDLVNERLPCTAQYVVFDSTFHANLPEVARTYALPATLSERFKKHGFHGLSYADVLAEAQWYLGETRFKAVLLHLGTGGSSACAVRDGESVDTSMGYSPLAGLVMNTRCGDLDPGILVELVRGGYTADDIARLLYRESGLLGVSDGQSADIRDLIDAMDGNARAGLAVDLYVYRAKQYIGAYAAILNGLDLVIFTDDVGLRVPRVRATICRDMDALGIVLDEHRNAQARPDRIEPLHTEGARVRILSVPNDEECSIYSEGLDLLRASGV